MATPAVCKIEGCDKGGRLKRGMCSSHYNAWYRATAPAKDVCAVTACNLPRHAHGYCSRHAARFKAHGDPLGGRRGSSPGEPLAWIEAQAQYDGDDCLPWPFEVGRYGYGTVKQAGKKRVASRVMCEVAHGRAPAGDYQAAHSCGNGHKACMNPRHLSWKSRRDNVADSIQHGTWNHGEKVPQHKLTAEQVLEIRARASTEPASRMAERYGVTRSAIGKVLARQTWAWLK